MPLKAPPFDISFEIMFLDNYETLGNRAKKAVDKAVRLLAADPRHPSLNVHKARNVKAKYPEGGAGVFIAYATRDLRITFEYGPEPGMISMRNCGHHDRCERKM
ncbi:MAG: cytotoxin [Deltaproteobacteria bacterium]|nr:cytotoxin [Deltaproteobacteria bacterium]